MTQTPSIDLAQMIQEEEAVLREAIANCSNDDYRSVSDATLKQIATRNVETLGASVTPSK